jgi:putative ABC transport system permease protein
MTRFSCSFHVALARPEFRRSFVSARCVPQTSPLPVASSCRATLLYSDEGRGTGRFARWERLVSVFSYLRELFNSLFRRAQTDADLDEEFLSHIQRHASDLERSGLPRPEAERQARIAFGSAVKAKENCREQRPAFWLEAVWQDVTYGVRMLCKSPGFTGIAILTLALGIGANTAIFSVIDTVLLRPLPYKNPANLVWAAERFPSSHAPSAVISPDFPAWAQRNQVFEQIGAFTADSANLTDAGEPTRVNLAIVTTDFFSLLGVKPILGRAFLASEGREANSQVALLNESLWRGHFGSEAQIVGKTILLDDRPFTVLGVMPATLRYPSADIWTPLALDAETFSPQQPRWSVLTVIARLKPGISAAQAQSDLQIVTKQMDHEYPPEAAPFRAGVRIEVVPLRSVFVQNVRPLLLVLLAAVTLILLIASANVANLLLSHHIIRGREMAVRVALGASRRRLIRQMLTESALLAVAGGAIGMVLGFLATNVLQPLIPSDMTSNVQLDPWILAFCLAVTVLVVLAFGLFPAIIASRPYVHEALKTGAAQSGTSYGAHRLRAVLTASQIGLSLVLLVGAGLLARSFLHLTEVNLGFDPHGLLLASVERSITAADFNSPKHILFFQDTVERLKHLPGVEGAALTTHYPLSIPNRATGILQLEGTDPVRMHSPISTASVSSDYFRVMRTPLLRGRPFSERDTSTTARVVILNESLAHTLFGARNALGQHISFGPEKGSWYEVVGVVSDTAGSSLEQGPMLEMFVPYLQDPSFFMTFVLRATDHPESYAEAVRAAVESVDKNQPLSELSTMDDIVAKSIAPRRFRMLLLGLFAFLAFALATIGIYGVMSYNVEQRTHEIGVRTALGAARGDILRLIVAQGFKITLLGILAGVAGALALTRYMASLLYSVSATDPVTFVLVPLLLSTAALIACYIPARSASRLDPIDALRTE